MPFMRLHLPLVGATTADQGRDQIIIVTITVLLCSGHNIEAVCHTPAEGWSQGAVTSQLFARPQAVVGLGVNRISTQYRAPADESRT